ncbi:MAG: acyl-CoA dehydrogenase family protein [Pseudomonadales bacterium]|nr:acyl-CoA dehydrogenase family protein [Pseudomonadales bacterium]
MNYLTEERQLIKESARKFTDKEVVPVAKELDAVQGDIPMSLRKKLADMGYFGIMIPEEYGGLGLGCFEYCLVAEELARGWMSVASLIARGNGMVGVREMSEEQKKETLPRVASGDYLCAIALSEPEAGSDIANVTCRAVKDGDDWIITGSKYWCTFADGADYILVMVRTDPKIDPNKKHRGLTFFKIEKEVGKLPEGVNGSEIPKIGYFGWKTWELHFDSVRVPASAMVGSEGGAFYAVSADLVTARAHTAARAIGLAQAALEDATAYALEREQFGRSIADFQVTRFKLAKMATEIEAARQLNYHVCAQVDTGQRCDKEAGMSKYFASEMSERVTSEALQILGGAGYTKLHSVERYWRDSRLTKIFEGTSEIQLRIISDHILGKSKFK